MKLLFSLNRILVEEYGSTDDIQIVSIEKYRRMGVFTPWFTRHIPNNAISAQHAVTLELYRKYTKKL